MSRLSQLDITETSGVTADLFNAIKKAAGRVTNAYAGIGTHSPAAHTVVGKMAGLSEAETRQIRAGEATGNDKRDALVRFVRTLAASYGTAPAGVLNAVRETGYTNAQVVDALFAMSVINFTNLFNRVNDTTLDFPKLV